MDNAKPSDFKVGQWVTMRPWLRSHVKEPYDVIITEVGEDYIKTFLHGEHELTIDKNNWEYQTKRMINLRDDK